MYLLRKFLLRASSFAKCIRKSCKLISDRFAKRTDTCRPEKLCKAVSATVSIRFEHFHCTLNHDCRRSFHQIRVQHPLQACHSGNSILHVYDPYKYGTSHSCRDVISSGIMAGSRSNGRGNFRGVFATHVADDIHGRGKVRPTNIVTSWMLARQRRKIEPSAFISASVYGRAGVRVLPQYSNIIRGLHAAKVFLVLSLCSCWVPTRNTTGGGKAFDLLTLNLSSSAFSRPFTPARLSPLRLFQPLSRGKHFAYDVLLSCVTIASRHP